MHAMLHEFIQRGIGEQLPVFALPINTVYDLSKTAATILAQ